MEPVLSARRESNAGIPLSDERLQQALMSDILPTQMGSDGLI